MVQMNEKKVKIEVIIAFLCWRLKVFSFMFKNELRFTFKMA